MGAWCRYDRNELRKGLESVFQGGPGGDCAQSTTDPEVLVLLWLAPKK